MTKLATGVLAVLLTTTSPVLAASIVENFDGENGGASQLNYSGFTKLDVTSGTADIIRNGDFGISCAGGSGSCVDLDGSTNSGGTLTTKTALSFNAGDVVTLSFDLSGNQRGYGPDSFFGGFDFTSPTQINGYTLGGGFGTFNVGDFFTTSILTGSSISGSSPFTTYSLSFTAGQAGSAFAFVGTGSADSVGPVLDNFSFSTSGVPEPATWALMVVGMGMVGYGMRRRQATVLTYA